MSFHRGIEWAFFVVLNCNDIWMIFKQFIYINKKKSNMYNYKNGDIAAYHGYLGLLQNNNNLYLTQEAMNNAAEMGHLEVIEFLHKNRTEGCTTFAMNAAAEYGHLEIVKYLHENICPATNCEGNGSGGCTRYAMNMAAANGHLEVVKYLHKNRKEGCTEYAMTSASKNGHLEVVKYLHENICIYFLGQHGKN
jgi:hypothetical protein